MYTEIDLEKIDKNLSLKLGVKKPDYFKNGHTVMESAHIHSCYEIYVNVSGNVSFLVESTLYPIKKGDIIITMPNEMHHCVYNSDGIHERYCFWFDFNDPCNDISKVFSKRKMGEGNHISMNSADNKALCAHIERLYSLSNAKKTDSSSFLASCYSIFDMICSHSAAENSPPYDFINEVMVWIDENLSEIHCAEDVAKHFFISRSSLYRLFDEQLKLTPAKYIEHKRLSLAKQLMTEEHSIKYVCEACGFNDYSHFISVFRKKFNITPYKYIKSISK